MALGKNNLYHARLKDKEQLLPVNKLAHAILAYNGKDCFWTSPVAIQYRDTQWVFRVTVQVQPGKVINLECTADHGFICPLADNAIETPSEAGPKPITAFTPLDKLNRASLVLTIFGYKPIAAVRCLSIQRTWSFATGPNVVNGFIVQ